MFASCCNPVLPDRFIFKHRHVSLFKHKSLTKKSIEEVRSGAGRQVDAEVVNRCARQSHTNSHQSVDGVSVKGNHHQKNAAQAVDDWEEQGQLQRADVVKVRNSSGG